MGRLLEEEEKELRRPQPPPVSQVLLSRKYQTDHWR
jgi:hypothetical protein